MIPAKESKTPLSLSATVRLGEGRAHPITVDCLPSRPVRGRQPPRPPSRAAEVEHSLCWELILASHLAQSCRPRPNSPLLPVHCGEWKVCPKLGAQISASGSISEWGEILRAACTIEGVFFHGDPTGPAIVVAGLCMKEKLRALVPCLCGITEYCSKTSRFGN